LIQSPDRQQPNIKMALSRTFFCLASLLALSLTVSVSTAEQASVPGSRLATMGRKLMQSDEYCPAGSSGPWKCPTCNLDGYSTIFCCKPGYGNPHCLCPSGPRCFPLRSRTPDSDSESTPTPTPTSDASAESFVSSYLSTAAPNAALPPNAAPAPVGA